MGDPVSLISGDDVMICAVKDEAVLLHVSTERYLTLNESALRMWELLTAGSEESALRTLGAEFEVDPERLRADLEGFRRQVLELGLATEGR